MTHYASIIARPIKYMHDSDRPDKSGDLGVDMALQTIRRAYKLKRKPYLRLEPPAGFWESLWRKRVLGPCSVVIKRPAGNSPASSLQFKHSTLQNVIWRRIITTSNTTLDLSCLNGPGELLRQNTSIKPTEHYLAASSSMILLNALFGMMRPPSNTSSPFTGAPSPTASLMKKSPNSAVGET